MPNGPYQLRLTAHDKAGNVSVMTVPITLDNMHIENVTTDVTTIHPLAGETVTISFTLPKAAEVTLTIKNDLDDAVIQQITQNFSSGGVHSIGWDGTDQSGDTVPEEAYVIELNATDGVSSGQYLAPACSGCASSGTYTNDTIFSTAKNDFWKTIYTYPSAGNPLPVASAVRARLNITAGTNFFTPYQVHEPGSFPLVWNGRHPDTGLIVSGGLGLVPELVPLRDNIILVKGTAPAVTGLGAAPNIEIKSNPYRVSHSYGQFSQTAYQLDQDAYVSVKLLPPGVGDPNDPAAIEVMANQLQSGAQIHTVDWRGHDAVDTNNILVSEEGLYTFSIEATSAASGLTTVYRGALKLYW
jgi:hypothetical protein